MRNLSRKRRPPPSRPGGKAALDLQQRPVRPSPATDGSASPVSVSSPPATASGGQLTAAYQTVKTDGNGNYLARMVVSASGGSVSGWSVVITLPVGATVTLTGGVASAQQGATVRFASDGNPQVPTGSTVVFTFTVHKPAGTILPLSCSVNGHPCAGW